MNRIIRNLSYDAEAEEFSKQLFYETCRNFTEDSILFSSDFICHCSFRVLFVFTKYVDTKNNERV